MRTRRAPLVLLLALASAGCQTEGKEPPGAEPSEPSPNASILPAPLASDLPRPEVVHDAGVELGDAGPDAGSIVVQSVRQDTPLGEDSALLQNEPGTTSLHARWRWLDIAPPSRSPETNVDAIERARGDLDFDLDVDLAPSGRMRVTLAADSFVLPRGTELHARYDLFGHAVIWPDKSKYALLAPGSLRALFNERRSDVVPLARPKASVQEGGQLLGLSTERERLVTPYGRVDLDQARIVGSGLGGALLCRALLELAAAHPDSTLCAADLLPLRAEYTWTDGGRASFEVLKQSKASMLDADALAMPPARALFTRGELPAGGAPALVAGPELTRFRLRPLAKQDKPEKPDKRDALAVKEGLLVVNRGELSTYLLVDGVPVLRLAPRSEDTSLPLVSGTYFIAARDFLGSVVSPPGVVHVPARMVLSEVADSGR